MSKRFILLFTTILILGFQNSFAQTNDPILFSVEGNPVQLSEFEYIYSKTNGDKADFSKKSLDEYLDLYIKFKLKVQRAKEMKLDTIPVLQQELAGYRKQNGNVQFGQNLIATINGKLSVGIPVEIVTQS